MANKKWYTYKCPICGQTSYVTGWLPSEGYDANMRQWQCSNCGKYFYVVVRNPTELKYIDRVFQRV